MMRSAPEWCRLLDDCFIGIYFISEDIFTLASYYQHDLHEVDFLPEGWTLLPDDEKETMLMPGGNHVE